MSIRELLVTEDGSHTLFIPEMDETYHSTFGAIQESNYVYIEQGLKFYAKANPHEKIMLFELGFGTGLNALLCALMAKNHELSMFYETVEPYPVSLEEVQKLNFADLLKDEDAAVVFSQIHKAPWNEQVDITSFFTLKKHQNLMQEIQLEQKFNICFFDAFSPLKQPEMWEIDMLEKIYLSLKSGGVIVTYCAKGQLKRDLKSLGFEVETLPGPPGKMQIVRGVKI